MEEILLHAVVTATAAICSLISFGRRVTPRDRAQSMLFAVVPHEAGRDRMRVLRHRQYDPRMATLYFIQRCPSSCHYE